MRKESTYRGMRMATFQAGGHILDLNARNWEALHRLEQPTYWTLIRLMCEQTAWRVQTPI